MRSRFIVLLGITLVTLAVYAPCLRAPFLYDDQGKIVENPDIKDWENLWEKLVYPYGQPKWERNDPSRPVTYLTYALNYRAGGLDPFGYHCVNLALHVLNAILVFFLSRAIFRRAFQEDSLVFPSIAAAFFSLHPINTTVACYAFSRSGALAAFFSLSSLLLFIGAAEGRRTRTAPALACFVLALFSKQDALTLPALLLILDFVILSDCRIQGPAGRKALHGLFWLVLGAWLAWRQVYLGGVGDREFFGGGADDWPPLLYLSVEPFVLARYLCLLLVPKGLSLAHVLARPETLLQWRFLASYLLLASMAALAWLAYRKKTKPAKLALLSILWFYVGVSPTSSFFPTTTVMAENRVYLPALGFYLVLAGLYHSLLRPGPGPDSRRVRSSAAAPLAAAALIAHLAGLAYATFRRSAMFRSPSLLWEEALALYPGHRLALYNAAAAHNNEGIAHRQAGRMEMAMRQFQRAASLKPDMLNSHYNLGLCHYILRDYEQALKAFSIVAAMDPKYPEVHNNLGAVYLAQKRHPEALREFERAVAADPSSAKAHGNLAYLLLLGGDPRSALREFEAGLHLDPASAAIRAQVEQLRARSK